MCIIINYIKTKVECTLCTCMHAYITWHQYIKPALQAPKKTAKKQQQLSIMHGCPEHFVWNTRLIVNVGTCAVCRRGVRSVSCCNMNAFALALESLAEREREIWLTAGSSRSPSLSARLTSRTLYSSAPIRGQRSLNQVIEAGLCLSDSLFPEFDLIAGIIWYPYSLELRMCWWGRLFKKISPAVPRSLWWYKWIMLKYIKMQCVVHFKVITLI